MRDQLEHYSMFYGSYMTLYEFQEETFSTSMENENYTVFRFSKFSND